MVKFHRGVRAFSCALAGLGIAGAGKPARHVKDVSESLAAMVRGGQTGIALSHCSVGDGVNAENIQQCLQILRDTAYDGHLSIECEGQGGPMLTKSLDWLRATMRELNITEDTTAPLNSGGP